MSGRCGRRVTGWRGLGCGLRMTAPREAIYQALAEMPGHPSADEVFLKVRAGRPGIGLATVYRNLDLLRNGGHIRLVDVGDGKARYELNHAAGGEGHHHHLICRRCGRVMDYRGFEREDLKLIGKIQGHLAKKYGFVVSDHQLDFWGECQKCAHKNGGREDKR